MVYPYNRVDDDEKELRTNEELSKELRQLMINTQIQRLKYLRGVQDDIICPILTGNVTKDNEQSILVSDVESDNGVGFSSTSRSSCS